MILTYLADIHTHSIASGHGTSCTISDMAKEAGRKGMKLLGITDHGPGTLASGTSSYFRGLPFCPRKRFGVEVLYGVELNILDIQGHVDLSDELLSNLDYAIISMHGQNYRSGTVKENTLAYQNAMKYPAVKVLGHCDNPAFPVDYDTLAYTASRENVIFEINEVSLTPGGYRGDTRANNAEILRCCLKYQLPIVLSSDSHGKEHVGDFTYAAEFVHQTGFPESLILNNQIPRLKVFLQPRYLYPICVHTISYAGIQKKIINRYFSYKYPLMIFFIFTGQPALLLIWTHFLHQLSQFLIFPGHISIVLSLMRKLTVGTILQPTVCISKIPTTSIPQCI